MEQCSSAKVWRSSCKNPDCSLGDWGFSFDKQVFCVFFHIFLPARNFFEKLRSNKCQDDPLRWFKFAA